MEANTTIAILLATHNGEQFLREQIESILDQSYKDWSIFVHDDESKDGTSSIIDEYVMKCPDKVFRVKGASCGCARNNFFYLLRVVDADYYMFCDQDDIWMPDKIEKSFYKLRQIECSSKPSMVFTELTVVDVNNNVIAERMSNYQNLNCKKITLNRFLIQNAVTGCTVIINRKLRDMMLKFNNIENIKMHDWWAGIIAATFGNIAFINEPTIWYRQHTDNSVGAQNDNSITYQINRVRNKNSMRQSLEATRMQAKELVEAFDLPAEHLISQYANCMEFGKLKRLRFYFKNDILKTGIARIIGQIVLG